MLKKLKKGGVWALALSMVVTMTPASAFATDSGDPSEAPVTDDTEQVLLLDGENDPVETGASLSKDQGSGQDQEEIDEDALEDAFYDLNHHTACRYLGVYGVFEGLFRTYDGTNKWTTGTTPKLSLNSSSKLKEGTDFKREYAFCKNLEQVCEAYEENNDNSSGGYGKKEAVITMGDDDEGGNQNGEGGNQDGEGGDQNGEGGNQNGEGGSGGPVEPESLFVDADEAAEFIEPGYILERIYGVGDYEECYSVYALHFIAVPMTIKADDAYKTKPDDYDGRTGDPYFTSTVTIGDLPEGMKVTRKINEIPEYVHVIRAEIEGTPETADKLGELTLIPILAARALYDRTHYSPIDEESTDGKSVYRLVCSDYGYAGGDELRPVGPRSESGESAAVTAINVRPGSGSEVTTEKKKKYDPPVQLELLPGTLLIENDDPLPASQSRIAKQLEATNLVKGDDGKYTTKVKMSLPLVTDKEVKAYIEKMKEAMTPSEGGGGMSPVRPPEYLDQLDDPSVITIDAQDSYAVLERGYGMSMMYMGKQNEYIPTRSIVAFDLSSDFDLPVDKDGALDISRMHLVDSMYFPEYNPGENGNQNGNGGNNENGGGDMTLRGTEDTDPMAAIMKWLTTNIFKEEPVRDGDFLNFDLIGYRIDPDSIRATEDEHEGWFPEDCELIGFGLKHWQTEQDYGFGDDTDGENTEAPEYDINDFAFVVYYLPTGMTGASEEFLEESKYFAPMDYTEITGPALLVEYDGLFSGFGSVNPMDFLNVLHHFSFQFEEELANPSTAPGVYGSYDQYGKNGGSSIKVVEKATLHRPAFTSGPREILFVGSKSDVTAESSVYYPVEKPEEFYIPTVSYTIGGGGNNNSPGSGGRTSSGTSIFEPQVPLAELPELNKKDHVAYVIGYEDGTVRPENYITRAEVSTIFFRLLTDDSRKAIWSSSNSYKDTVATAWYNNAVSTLSNGGVLSGYTDGTFLPSGNITRAEFATIAARFDESVVDTNSVSFTDISGHWAEKNIKRAAALGYITGYQDGSFKPNAPITRAEAMTLMNRVLGRDKITAAGLLNNMTKFTDNPASAWYYVAVQEATNSHDYTIENGVETWTGIIANRDWAALEKEWATGAERGAEVFQPEEEVVTEDVEAEAGEEAAAEA